MRYLCALLICLTGFAQSSITAVPSLPTTGVPTTFILRIVGLPPGPVTWQFGDGQSLTGGTVVSHLYRQPGSYTVLAGGQFATVSLPIRVVAGTGPAAPFAISLLRLRWEDGRTDVSVVQGHTPLLAYADLKFEGTGLLQAQWAVDGVILGTFVKQLGFAGSATVDTGLFLPLPTTEPGEHLVSFRILTPDSTFTTPTIRYFVRAGDGENLARVDDVSPAAVRPGEEVELRVAGRGLGPGVRLSFGKDVAVVAAPRFSDPGHALVKVFVSPTARAGLRDVQTLTRGRRAHGPAKLQVLPPRPRKVPPPPSGPGRS